jgi:transcriptional regulator with XRE-family HTH domain
MGHGKRARPRKLGKKLRFIREKLLGLTQAAMAEELKKFGADSTLHSGYIADFENNKEREPSLLTLLAYSKLSMLTVNTLIDDKEVLNFDVYNENLRRVQGHFAP